MSDKELAAGIEAGDLDALQHLIDTYHVPLYRYLRNLDASKEDGEDLAVQSLLRARSSIRKYRGSGRLRGWIYRVAYREFLILRRRQILFKKHAGSTDGASDPPGDDMLVIEQALSRLPIAQRSAFMLIEIEELSVAEASAALGVPAGTVKSRCHHAKKKLQEILGSTYGEIHAETVTE